MDKFYSFFHNITNFCEHIDQYILQGSVIWEYGYGPASNLYYQIQKKDQVDKKAVLEFNTEGKEDQYDITRIFLKFMRQNFLLTLRTPNIICLYRSGVCDSANFKSFVTNEVENTEEELAELLSAEQKIQYSLLEYVEDDTIEFFLDLMNHFNAGEITDRDYYHYVQSVIFQFVYTLATIEKYYENFTLGLAYRDYYLFKRANISASNEYLSYTFNNQTFYVPAHGGILKIDKFINATLDNPNKDPIKDMTSFLLHIYYHLDRVKSPGRVMNFFLQLVRGASMDEIFARPERYIKTPREYLNDPAFKNMTKLNPFSAITESFEA